MIRTLAAIISLSLGITATAYGAEYSPVLVGYNDGRADRIRLFSQAECVAALTPIVSPEAIIAKGLAALQNPSPTQDALACIEQLVTNWDKALGENPKAISEGETSSSEESASDLGDKIYALLKQIDCTPPEAGPITPALWKEANAKRCAGKFTDRASLPVLKDTLDKLRILSLRKGIALELESGSDDLLSALIPKPSISPEVGKLKGRLACDANHDTSSTACLGPSLTPTDKEVVAKAIRSATDAYDQEYSRYQDIRAAWAEMLDSFHAEDTPIDPAAYRRRYAKLKCLESGVPGQRETAKRSYCESKGYSTVGDGIAEKEAFRALAVNTAKIADDWSKSAEMRKQRKAARLKNLSAESDSEYGLRRLLAYFKAFAKGREESTDLIAGFCRANELSQQKDMRYLASTHTLQLLSREGDWLWASVYGASESEITAIREYTGSTYLEINGAFWEASKAKKNYVPSPEVATQISAMREGLAKAPSFTSKPVRRFSALPAAVLSQHKVGSIVTYEAFTSTSKSDAWLFDNSQDDAVNTFLIYPGKSAIDIQPISS
ncbi:MAG: hypothetical protein EOP11_19695, partial [Proteobacteria bacterium]